jgi:hypothetical protein
MTRRPLRVFWILSGDDEYESEFADPADSDTEPGSGASDTGGPNPTASTCRELSICAMGFGSNLPAFEAIPSSLRRRLFSLLLLLLPLPLPLPLLLLLLLLYMPP